MTTIKQRGGTAAQWASANPVLAAREVGVTTDTKVIKIGDGVTAWNSLPEAGSGSYAGIGKDATGNRAAVFGDSLANNGQGVAYYIAAVSKQRLWFPDSTYVQSTPGASSAALLAVLSGITALSPRPSMCLVTAGSNDAAGGVPLATFAANMTTIYRTLQTAGIMPIVVTIPPRTGVYSAIPAYNAWLRNYAMTNRLPLADWYAVLADPATGQYLSAYAADGIHPNSAGCLACANTTITAVQNTIAPAPPGMVSWARDGWNLAYAGPGTPDTNADGLSDGLSTTLASGYTVSRVSDTAGFWWQRATLASSATGRVILGQGMDLPGSATTTVTAVASAGASGLTLNDSVAGGAYIVTTATGERELLNLSGASGGGAGAYTKTFYNLPTVTKLSHAVGDTVVPAVKVGDLLSFAIKIRNGQASTTFRQQLTCYTAGQASVTGNLIIGSPNTVNGFDQQVTDGLIYGRITVPANTAYIGWDSTFGSTDGTYDFALPTILNLSQLGVS